MEINCLQCNKKLAKHQIQPNILKRGGGKYCSRKCRAIFVWSNPEYRKHMSNAHKGNMPTNIDKLVSYHKSKEWKEKMSEWSKLRTGEKSHFYKDGRAIDKKAYNKIYRKNNLKLFANYSMIRKARRVLAGGSHTIEQWEELKNKYNLMCLCCKKYEPEIKLTVDHIVPLTMGGTNGIENIQPLCGSCNSRKNVKTIDYKLTLNN